MKLTPTLADATERVKATIGAGLTPLEYALIVMRDERNPVERRLEGAKAALPYCHQTQPQDVTVDARVHISTPIILVHTMPPG